MARKDAVTQVEAGVSVLDVNIGVPDTDEVALKLYDGKALINSVHREAKSLKSVLPRQRNIERQ